MKSSLPIPDELLSAYIDRQISDAERRRVESALAADPFLQQRLDALRSIVELLQNTPAVVAPRALTLTEEQALAAGILTGDVSQSDFFDRWLPRLMPVATVLVGVLFAVSLVVPLGEAPIIMPERVEKPVETFSQEAQKFEEEAIPPAVVLTQVIEPSSQSSAPSFNAPATAVDSLSSAQRAEAPPASEEEDFVGEGRPREPSEVSDEDVSKAAAPLATETTPRDAIDASADSRSFRNVSPASRILGVLFMFLLLMTGWVSYTAWRRV